MGTPPTKNVDFRGKHGAKNWAGEFGTKRWMVCMTRISKPLSIPTIRS